MDKLLYDRFVIDFKTWIKTLNKICKEHNNTELIPVIKQALVDAKDRIPQKEQSAAGFNNFETEADIKGMSNYDLGKACLTFADDSIESGGVWQDGNDVTYRTTVTNTDVYAPILLSDYMVNMYRVREKAKPYIMIFDIKVDTDDTSNDPFVQQMNTVFSEYFPEVVVNISKA